jgi:hypothetical protein
MKRLGKLKLFGLVVFLTAALIFVGIDYLEGKKPPKWEWKVGIPNLAMAEEDGCNLYANLHGNPMVTLENPGYITYEKNDFVDVEYWTSEDKDTGEFHSIFSLKLENTEKGISNNPGDYSIGFRDLQFIGCRTYCSEGGTGPCLCWVLPNYADAIDCCTAGCTGPGSGGYWVMQEFMENNAHPSFGYDHFSLRIIVYCDVEAIGLDESVTVDGYMWRINVWNTGDTLLEGNEDYHNIVCAYWILLEEVEVFRSGENEWKITVDQCGFHNPDGGNSCFSKYGHSGRYIVFYEYYNQGIEKPIGKSGKSKIDSENRWALGAATAFKFVTKWTRY